MVNREKFDAIIDSLHQIDAHYGKHGFEESIRQIESVKNKFDIKLMVVGHFNAGKSSLLNGLIGRPGFLKEAQLPQTAIATELVYDEDECSYAYKEDGKQEQLRDGFTYLPNEYSHLEYRLSSPALKQISDYTIVDTPGFDSGVEEHTKALANYIGIGSAYIVVIDQEKGGIDGTTQRFVEEISHYSSQIAILINKCDKITDDTAKSIASSAEATLLSRRLAYKVYTISKHDPSIAEKLVSIISNFDAQIAFDRAIEKRIRTELFNIDYDIAKRRFINNVVPQICNKIYPQIKQNVENSTNQVVCEYKKMLDEKLELLKSNVVAAESKRKEKEEAFESYRTNVMEDIARIHEMIQELG